LDFFDIKADVESLLDPVTATYQRATHPAFHPGRCAVVLVDGREVGHVGELHPRWVQAWGWPSAPVLFEIELDAVLARPFPQGQALSRVHPVE
ncbi:hypothetical protein OVV65_26875, partial [Klebsiella pneumoniae]|nr:hypothetical protein [Klebsiella pneumoniae]